MTTAIVSDARVATTTASTAASTTAIPLSTLCGRRRCASERPLVAVGGAELATARRGDDVDDMLAVRVVDLLVQRRLAVVILAGERADAGRGPAGRVAPHRRQC